MLIAFKTFLPFAVCIKTGANYVYFSKGDSPSIDASGDSLIK